MKGFFESIDKKKIIVFGIGILLFIILIFVVIFIYNKFFTKKTYAEVEKNMKNAAITYLKNNSDELPTENDQSITISDTTLINSGLMKSVNEQLKAKGYTCTGEVIVTNINGGFRYNPILDCGDYYNTVKLVDYINNNVTIVESGNGLYNLNNELVYRGDKVNNYIKLSNKTYRILKVSNNEVYIIYTDLSKELDSNWDNRYNIDKKSTVGINDYTVSKIRDSIDNLYNGSSLLSDSDKLMISSYDLKIGARDKNESNKTGSVESSKILENQYIGLLPVYDFINASIDVNCNATVDRSCMNYNYLARYSSTWWLTTANSANTYTAYMVSGNSGSNGGYVVTATTNKTAYIRPVLKLAADVMYVSGDGSSKNPIIIK